MKPLPTTRWVLISSLCLAVILGTAVFKFLNSRDIAFDSSPTAIRPWAEAEFLRLTKPVPSTGSPLHPQYLARHGGLIPSSSSTDKARVITELPSNPFVPNYEVIEFDAADGFTSGARSVKIRWMAAKPYDLPADPTASHRPSPLPAFHSDGKPMTNDEMNAAGITKQKREAWGLELNGELGTAMMWQLDLEGFTDFRWKFQQVFDANTHVPLLRNPSVTQSAGSLLLGASLSVLHDAPLIAVIDLAHGETQTFDIPVARGAKVNHADFQLEVIDVLEGSVNESVSELIRAGKAIDQRYRVRSLPRDPASFSVIYQINPPVMGTAVSVDALDATGQPFKDFGRFMEPSLVSKFGAPLASAVSLRIRYRPLQTRLLMRIESVPGVTPPNLKPTNLFDVKAPNIGLGNSLYMRHFIANGAQLKDITRSSNSDTPGIFPMHLQNVTYRQMADRYLRLDPNREIKIDPVAMTVEFEEPQKPSIVSKIKDWVKRWL